RDGIVIQQGPRQSLGTAHHHEKTGQPLHTRSKHAKIFPMCNRYVTPDQAATERYWHIGRQNPPKLCGVQVHPPGPGPFIRAGDQGPELTVGQWALIPPFARDPKLPYSTNNARAEELAQK